MPEGETEDLEGGWTRIGRGKGSRPKYIHGIPPAAKGLTVEHLRAEYNKKMQTWRRSSARAQLVRLFTLHRPDEGWQIVKAVCLATNSFSRDNLENTRRAMTQFVAFMDMVDQLNEAKSVGIKVYAQDPNYTPLDSLFLVALGVEVLYYPLWPLALNNYAGPQARDHFGPHTFVFEPFMELDPQYALDLMEKDIKLLISARKAEPKEDMKRLSPKERSELADGVVVRPGDPVDKHQNTVMRLRQEIGRKYHSTNFPRFEEDPNVFEGLGISWKKQQDEDADEEA